MTAPTRRQFAQQATVAAAALLCPSEAGIASGRPQNSISPATIRKLSSELSGRVITHDSPEYESSRLVFNRAFDGRPALIVCCSGVADVRRALAFAQRQNLVIAIRGGGHSRAGFGVCDGGMVIDLSKMNGVKVDARRQLARAEAGALVRDMDRATQALGFATTMGGCPTVGVAGLTLGGGEGLLMSKYGAACDNLVSADLITPHGEQLKASETSNPDLFWAIRGGGGNFGVVTALEYRLHAISDVLAGTLTYAPGRIPELLEAFVRFVSVAPDEMNVVGVVLPSSQGARFHMLVCHCGELRQGNDLLKPLRAFQPEQDDVRLQSYAQTQETINPYTPAAHFQTNLFLPKLGASVIAAIARAADNAPPNTRLFMVPLYGAISRVKTDATAFPLRQPGYELDIMGRWNAAGERAEAVRWVETLRDQLQAFSRGVYANQLGETSQELVKAAYGPNYQRLVQIKRKYDPQNILRLNQNIQPT